MENETASLILATGYGREFCDHGQVGHRTTVEAYRRQVHLARLTQGAEHLSVRRRAAGFRATRLHMCTKAAGHNPAAFAGGSCEATEGSHRLGGCAARCNGVRLQAP